MKKKIPLEKDIQLACCQYLELKRHFFWRQNTTPTFDITKKTFRAMPKFSLKGVPDIIVIGNGGQFIGIEIKRPGGKLREEQQSFKEMCQRVGAQYHTITDVSQLIEIGL